MLVDGDGLDGLSLHVHIPDLDGQVVARQDMSAIEGEADVGDGRDDFGKERTRSRIFFLLKFCESYQYMSY